MLSKNNNLEYGEPIADEFADMLGDHAAADARLAFEAFFDDFETPLVALPGMARRLGVGELFVKDESARMGLASFKAMGGAYAVLRVVLAQATERIGRPICYRDFDAPDVRAAAKDVTVCCATDGNHGRSVALGAKLAGCRAVIYLHTGVSRAREQAICDLGAETARVDGGYDASVAYAAAQALAHDWRLVTDTSWPGNEHTPGTVMQGYGVIAAEIAARMARPTHIFIQAGVGGFAASIAGFYALRFRSRRPRIIVVEPQRAACLFASNRAGRRVSLQAGQPTIMAMLECHEPSYLAWQVLARAADFFMTVEEEDARAAMRRFAFPVAGDVPLVSGESGCVGLAAIEAAHASGDQERLRLNASSRVLIVNTEGATDPCVYETIVGESADDVEARRRRHVSAHAGG